MVEQAGREADSPGFRSIWSTHVAFGKAEKSRCGSKWSDAQGAFVPLAGKRRDVRPSCSRFSCWVCPRGICARMEDEHISFPPRGIAGQAGSGWATHKVLEGLEK